MTDIIQLAQGVADSLGEGVADVELAPEFTLKDVKEKTRIVVVPVGIKHKMLARGFREDLLIVQVGILRKATEDELVDLVNYAQSIALGFLHSTVCGARCVEANHNPLYSPEHMRERRQFTGVIELGFKEVNPHEVRH
jgi:hypothetical protein